MTNLLKRLIFTLALALIATPSLAVDTGGGSGGSGGGSSDTAPTVASMDSVRQLIDAEDYQSAWNALSQITAVEPENADAWNLFGFSSRKLGKMKSAAFAYSNALRIQPKHLGALEYQSEMFIKMGALDKAKANLEKLQSLCGDCEEAQDLAAAIAKG